MNTKDLIEAAKFQATVKPHDEFIVEVAERLETLYEENNRQKTEIERLEAEKQGTTEKFCCQQTVYADLSKIIKEQAEEIKVAKSEAVKKFAEKLIFEIVNRPSKKASDGVFYMSGKVDRQNEIIDIIKEMVGDDK